MELTGNSIRKVKIRKLLLLTYLVVYNQTFNLQYGKSYSNKLFK